MTDAFLCGPRGRVQPEQLTDDDRAALDGFAHLLRGGSGCLYCLTPDDQCATDQLKCCVECKHARLPARPTEGATP